MLPKSLKTWFIIHFFADIIFAIPLLIAPHEFLTLLGWERVDPFTTRLVSAALFGIGGASFVTRNRGRESYITLLDLKIIWSGFAIIGMVINLLQGAPLWGWAILATFGAFCGIWIYYRIRISTKSV